MKGGIDLAAAHKRTVRRLIESVLPRAEVWAYGSRVKGGAQPWSDLDLVVFAGPGLRRQVANLREAFDESDLPFRVDVLLWDELPESFRAEIGRRHVVVTAARTTPPASARSTP